MAVVHDTRMRQLPVQRNFLNPQIVLDWFGGETSPMAKWWTTNQERPRVSCEAT